MEITSEQILIHKLKDGDREAMKNLYGLYSGYLTAVCSRYIPDYDSLKDILQDSFVKIFMSIDRFEYRGEGSLKAWIRKIAVNEALKFLKRSSKDNTVSTDSIPDIPDNQEEEDLKTEDIPESVIQEMIIKLPDGYRTIFNLYVFEEMSHKEIASMLGIKENSSASQLHRAKAMLAKWINEYRKTSGLSNRIL